MNFQPIHYLIACLLCCLISCGAKQESSTIATKASASMQLITAGGTVTEIVNSLGLGDHIIATDKTSTFPTTMQQLPSIGYRNQIKAEGLIAFGADVILTEKDYLSPEVVKQLQAAGMTVHEFENKKTIEGTKELIQRIAKVLKVDAKGKELAQAVEADYEKANTFQEKQVEKPKVIFVYARGQGAMSIGGTGTFAEEMVRLAGGILAVPEIEGFKPLTPEALIAANPDYILFFTSGLTSLNGIEGVLKIPGVSETKAGKAQQIIAMDGLLLSGFDSRVGTAVLELSQLIH